MKPLWAYIYSECRHNRFQRFVLGLLGRHRHASLWLDGSPPITDPIEMSWTASGLIRLDDDDE